MPREVKRRAGVIGGVAETVEGVAVAENAGEAVCGFGVTLQRTDGVKGFGDGFGRVCVKPVGEAQQKQEFAVRGAAPVIEQRIGQQVF